MIKKLALLGCLALATVGSNIPTVEADFVVVPVRLAFEPGQSSVSLRVTHEATKNGGPGVYQVGVGEWTNPPNGRNVIGTRAIAAFPPVFRLKPGETQIIRVSKVNKRDPMTGKAFRVIVREVPSASRNKVNVAMRRVLNMPLMVKN